VGGRRGNGIGERGRKGEISQYFSLPKDIEDGEAQVFCFVLFCFVPQVCHFAVYVVRGTGRY
jgi:hypothetical protein